MDRKVLQRKANHLASQLLKSDMDYLDNVLALASIGGDIYVQCWGRSNISIILNLDPEKRKSESITIGMEITRDNNAIVYKIKEAGFKFTLSS